MDKDIEILRELKEEFLQSIELLKLLEEETDDKEDIVEYAYKCTQEEAKKYPQFRWVALEEL